MDRLKPCLCGSREVYSSTHIWQTAKDDYCKVSCLVCGYEVRAITLQEAEEKWNRRADDD